MDLGKLQIGNNVELKKFTSWQIGGFAEYFFQPTDLNELKLVLQWAVDHKQSVNLLGGGSNVLVSDDGVDGLVISLSKMNKISSKVLNDKLILECEAGAAKSELLKIFLQHKLAPALFLAGIPGQVGGGVVMNAGVGEEINPREFCQIVDWIEVLGTKPPFELKKINSEDLIWSYRACKAWQPGIIVRVGISCPYRPQENIIQDVRNANRLRAQKQPLDQPSCGSVFVNPPGMKAAQLIESCGLKGRRIGDAQVSLKHSNFIVNVGEARASDTWQLICDIVDEVKKQKSVTLHPEVQRFGRW